MCADVDRCESSPFSSLEEIHSLWLSLTGCALQMPPEVYPKRWLLSGIRNPTQTRPPHLLHCAHRHPAAAGQRAPGAQPVVLGLYRINFYNANPPVFRQAPLAQHAVTVWHKCIQVTNGNAAHTKAQGNLGSSQHPLPAWQPPAALRWVARLPDHKAPSVSPSPVSPLCF